MFLLDDLLLAPVKAVVWLAERVQEAADREFSDPGVLKQKLLDLQMMLELNQISEDDFRRRESELLARLEEVTKTKEGSHA
jgi:hypothetical protein